MAKRRVKLVRVPGTTSNIKTGIVNFLLAHGHYAVKIDTVGVWDKAKKTFRRSGTRKGTADVMGCIHYVKKMMAGNIETTFNCGLFIAIEVKNENTNDRVRPEQLQEADLIAKAGGLYLITPSVESFVQWYYTQDFHNDEPFIKALPN
jgi:hypothetical protein